MAYLVLPLLGGAVLLFVASNTVIPDWIYSRSGSELLELVGLVLGSFLSLALLVSAIGILNEVAGS